MTMAVENVRPIEGPVSHLPPVSETAAILHMIERLARDPSVDPDRIDRFVELRRSLMREEAEREFNTAMAIVQGKMRAVAADANNPQTRSRYASYYALDKAIRPIYSAEGLALSFDTEDSPKPDHIRVVCYVTRGIHTRKYKIDMPADGKGAKGGDVMTKTHAAGSASTYGQRYLLRMIFNIAIGDDDDGNAASPSPSDKISLDQVEQLISLCEEVNADKQAFCNYFRIASIADLQVKDYQRAVAALNKKRGAK